VISPGNPLAGRNVEFRLEGLDPWERVVVGFIGPNGVPAEWITRFEVPYKKVDGKPVVTDTMTADAVGKLSWSRIGTQDLEGGWTVSVSVDGVAHTVSYTVGQLQLDLFKVSRVGLELREYSGSVTTSYVSSLVPSVLALDLPAHLARVMAAVESQAGLASSRIPDVYLIGTKSLLETAAGSIGVSLSGWEAGFHWAGASSPGIFMRTDNTISALRTTLAHEYIHFLFDEQAKDVNLPAWTNEGCATYLEVHHGAGSDPAQAALKESYERADTAVQAQIGGTIPPLTALESQRTWNSTADSKTAHLQYSEAYMACRYLVEKYGIGSIKKLVGSLGSGLDLNTALLSTTGVSYRQFEDQFHAWLRSWTDAKRDAIKAAVVSLEAARDEQKRISAKRAASLNDGNLTVQVQLVAAARAERDRLTALACPVSIGDVCEDGVALFDALTTWLQLELDYYNNLDRSVLNRANGMIPEINGRTDLFVQGILDARFVYNLD
jgi:hypothetical protein